MKNPGAKILIVLLGLLAADLRPALADADSDWAAIVKLDAGPPGVPVNRDEALRFAHEHFARHRAALLAFIAAYPQDPRVLDAQLR
ncbi:MAG TPA: hypothetical protein VNB29_04700, partial [Chthoniobacterales bacterium]|nr:hypothetical protein [Chthoniobacterales bacterium]